MLTTKLARACFAALLAALAALIDCRTAIAATPPHVRPQPSNTEMSPLVVIGLLIVVFAIMLVLFKRKK